MQRGISIYDTSVLGVLGVFLMSVMGIMLMMMMLIETYPKSMDPYRIIPLITESYPYTKFHPNMGYDSVICHCLGYDLMRILNDSFLI